MNPMGLYRRRPDLVLCVGLLAGLAPLGPLRAEDRLGGDAPAKRSRILDNARMFSDGAVEAAESQLAKLARDTNVPMTIETVTSLDGQSIEEVSLKNAMKSGREGVYVLLAKDEKKIEVRASRHFKEVVDPAGQREIRDAFLAGLRIKSPDEGLDRAVETFGDLVERAKARGKLPPATAALKERDDERRDAPASSLIVRNQVRLTLAGARKILEGAEAKAAEMGLKMNIAVVDDGGHMISFARMDGARPASGYTATTKAVTAATFRQETGPLPKGATSPDPLLNISLQNAASASGGRVTTLFGGVPVVVDGQVIGGVGVGGGSGEQDATVAKAGIAAFLGAIPGHQAAEKPAGDRINSSLGVKR